MSIQNIIEMGNIHPILAMLLEDEIIDMTLAGEITQSEADDLLERIE